MNEFNVASICLDTFFDPCDQGMCNLLKQCSFMHFAAMRICEVVCLHVQLQCIHHGFHITHTLQSNGFRSSDLGGQFCATLKAAHQFGQG
jgi:hypothetical protein